MRVTLIRAWRDRHDIAELVVKPGASVREALSVAQWMPESVEGYAVFGMRAHMETVLHEGDRVEVLRPLQADPKDARRQRAKTSTQRK